MYSNGCHIHKNSYDAELSTLIISIDFNIKFTKWKYVLQYCTNCPSLFLQKKKKNPHYATLLVLNLTTTFSKCCIHVQLTLGEINKCLQYQNISGSEGKIKMYNK